MECNVEIIIRDKRILEAPKHGTANSAGVDLVACIDSKVDLAPGQSMMIDSGISVNMMTVVEDCMAILVPRSGKGVKGLALKNTVGIIDQSYHGPIKMACYNTNPDTYISIEPMERIAQLIFVPIIMPLFRVVDEFSTETERGEGGFGSTGNK